jgi:hypothetical protein
MMADKSISDLEAAYRARDAIRKLARDEVLSEYPRPRYAVVQSVDSVNRTCVVRYVDEETDFTVRAGSMLPLAGNAVVRLDGPNGARYIDDVISGEVSINGIDTSSGITTWTAVGFQNSWINQGSGFQVVQYRKERDLVRLRGMCKKSTSAGAGEVVFTLPADHRPSSTLYIGTWSSDNAASPIQAQRAIQINTNGTVVVASAMTGTSVWLSLDFCFSTAA